jgi:hypothetical protein
MRRGASIKKLAQKMVFFLTNYSAKILVHLLGYNFCAEHHILAHFCQMLLPPKASRITRTKAPLRWHQKCW